MMNLGGCYLDGIGVAKDVNEAVAWFTRSAKLGNLTSVMNLACLYDIGDPTGVVRSDRAKAKRWWAEVDVIQKTNPMHEEFGRGCMAVDARRTLVGRVEYSGASRKRQLGDTASQMTFGTWQQTGGRGNDLANRLVAEMAENGDRNAQFWMANNYRDGGDGTKPDPVKAVEWYRKAAERGHPNGQYSLGLSYYTGYGVQQDYMMAIPWFRRSAEDTSADWDRSAGR